MRRLHTHPRLAAIGAGLLSATGFAPLALWPITLACLCVLMLLVQSAHTRRQAFSLGWLFGVGHFTVGLNWIAHAFTYQDNMPHWFGYGAVILLSLYLAVYPALATLGAWWGRKWGAFPLLFAAAWIITEYLRATLFTGFAWNPLGVIWLPAVPIAWIATLVGTYGLSGITILAAGGLLFLARRHAAIGTAAAGVLVVAPFLWFASGTFLPIAPIGASPPGEEQAGRPRIRVIQPNIGQQDKYTAAFEERNFRKLADLSGQPGSTPRLLFWPEAAIPAYLDMEPEWRYRLAALLGSNDILLTGGTKVYFKEVDKGLYTDRVLAGANNSLWVVTPDARLAGRYDKAHLVPYGEYLPMRRILEPIGLSRLVPGDADFWPGPGPQSLTLPAVAGRPALRMGVQICYEIIFSGQVIDRANRPDFLFNPSNDAWFGSWGPPQHLAQARLRAIEEGIPVIRSTPTGISAVIDTRGRILQALPHQQAGAIDAALPPALAPTFFARAGNIIPLLLSLLLIGLAVARRQARR